MPKCRYRHSQMEFFGSYLWDLSPPLQEVLFLPCWCLQWRTEGFWLEQLYPDLVLLSSPCWDPQHPSQEPWKDCLEVDIVSVKHQKVNSYREQKVFFLYFFISIPLVQAGMTTPQTPHYPSASAKARSVMMVLQHFHRNVDNSVVTHLPPTPQEKN